MDPNQGSTPRVCMKEEVQTLQLWMPAHPPVPSASHNDRSSTGTGSSCSTPWGGIWDSQSVDLGRAGGEAPGAVCQGVPHAQ